MDELWNGKYTDAVNKLLLKTVLFENWYFFMCVYGYSQKSQIF